MSASIEQALSLARIIPVIALEDVADAVPLCRALRAGGLTVAEITFRTAAATTALELVGKELPEVLLGAGTVTTPDEVRAACTAGARFALAPGCNPTVIAAARDAGLPFFPGVCTPSEIELALQSGRSTLKFFPAEPAGGRKMLEAMGAPYRHRGVKFIPTGGISPENVGAWLRTSGVIACGGTWMVRQELLRTRNWPEITRLAAEAVALAKAAP